ncbi:MAG TPA: polymer-forming cytoskeletal protein [Candidatus Acidoferrales bacterium]|nr:polymer-forming cytoskeletal protein [Candidatus Acidoferrales bacterium]
MAETEVQKRAAAATNGGPADKEPVAGLTVLSREDALNGRLTIASDGHLLGTFRGEVDCAGELLVGRDAQVNAEIKSVNVTIAGTVRGNVLASGRLKITTSGRLEGDARVGSLIVQEGGVHHGVIRVHPEGVPAEEEKVIDDGPVQAAVTPRFSLRDVPNPVARVKKLWGEFF